MCVCVLVYTSNLKRGPGKLPPAALEGVMCDSQASCQGDDLESDSETDERRLCGGRGPDWHSRGAAVTAAAVSTTEVVKGGLRAEPQNCVFCCFAVSALNRGD